MNISTFEGILFDMDGVIIDSEPLHWQAEIYAFEVFGIHVPKAEFDTFVGVPAEKNFRYVIETYGKGDEDLEAMLHHKRDYFHQHRHALNPITGAVEFIKMAHQHGKRLGLVTSSNQEYQQFVFSLLGISELFEVVVTIEDVENGKPHPEPYQLAVRKLGIAASRCMVIEDSLAGVASGYTAGCFVGALATSFPVERLQKSEANVVFEDYNAIKSLFHR